MLCRPYNELERPGRVYLTSENFQLVVEFCAGCGAGAGQASVAVVQAGSIVSVGTTLLRHRQEGHCQERKQTFSGDDTQNNPSEKEKSAG